MLISQHKDAVNFLIPGKGISMNRIYAPLGRGNLVMVKAAKEFREKVITFTPYWKIDLERKPLFAIHGEIYDNWFRKDGKDLLKKDVGNLQKVLIDAIFYKWGVDDKYIWLHGPFLKYQDKDKHKIIVHVRIVSYLK